MHIRVIGSNIDTGESLSKYVEEHLNRHVKKYFKNAVNADVHFSKDGVNFKSSLVINEGVKDGVKIKSDAEDVDVYACFNAAMDKATMQLRKYKDRLKDSRRQKGGIKRTKVE